MEEAQRNSGPDVDERGIKPPPAFAIEDLAAPAGTLLLWLAGELDLASSADFRDRVETGLAAGARNVVIDMAEALFIDSSMLKELLRAQAAAEEAGGRLVLAGVRPAIQRLFEL